MFTNLASLLLGVASAATTASAENDEQVIEEAQRLNVLETEDDWLLVETETIPSQRGALLSSIAITPRSRSHSLSSLPCYEDESWYVTPPPCFTSTGPVNVETSPLENLLIEHPSMSVYQRPLNANTTQQVTRSVSLSPPPPPRVRQPLAVVNPRPPQRFAVVSMAKQQRQQITAMHAAQKVQQKTNTHVNRRSAMERTNKAREVGSARNKRPRRADQQLRHSGANNNRKC